VSEKAGARRIAAEALSGRRLRAPRRIAGETVSGQAGRERAGERT